MVRDIRDWGNHENPAFLNDLTEGNLSVYRSARHTETPRYQAGQNPPIFYVIRALTKAFQYDLKLTGEDLVILKQEISAFEARRDLANPDAQRWVEKNAKKLFQHAVDIEYACNTLS